MSRKDDGPRPPFPWRSALKNSLGKGVQAATLSGATVTITFPEPVTVATVCGVQFAGATVFGLAGEYMNHRYDDPSPVFDRPTIVLFDIVGMVLGFLLLAVPAMQLDLALRPGAALPGPLAIFALCLCAFLITVLRGLLVNLRLVRREDGYRSEPM